MTLAVENGVRAVGLVTIVVDVCDFWRVKEQQFHRYRSWQQKTKIDYDIIFFFCMPIFINRFYGKIGKLM